jgi:hypothetical protein
MKISNWLLVVIAVAIVSVGGIVFGQVQSARADELTGTVDNVTSSNITVGNKILYIDSNTEIIGDLAAGSLLQIRATVQADGTLLANRIQVRNTDDSQDENNENDDNEINGIIQSVSANSTSIVIKGQTILLNADTQIKGVLAVDARAKVEITTQADGSLLATEIEIKNSNNHGQNGDREKRGEWHQDNGLHMGHGD